MGDAGFFKGTSSEQDTRFKDKEKSLLKSINFPKELDHKVDMRKVELSVMRPWIAEKIMELLGFEDEVVVEYVNGLLDDPISPVVDPKRMQISLTGFLESKTGPFMSELWTLLLSAQQSPLKVPALFIEQKKEEMRKRELENQQAQALIKQRQQEEEEKERKLAEIRSRERGQQANNRDRDQNSDYPQRNRSRPEVTNGYPSRSKFVPPRERNSGWGNRGGTRLGGDSTREPPSNGKRERSHSPVRPRRDSHNQREYPSSYSRRPRSSMHSRSRSPPTSRRTYRRASPSPRPHQRHTDPPRSHRRGSPSRANERARLDKYNEGRSSSSDSAPRPARRHRSITRSISPPRHARRQRSISKSISPPRHSRRRRSITRSISPPRRRVTELTIVNGEYHDRSHDRHQSSTKISSRRRSRSPPPPKRYREENAKAQRSREREKDTGEIGDRRASSRSPSPHTRRSTKHSTRPSEDEGLRKDSARSQNTDKELSISKPVHSPQATPASIHRSSPGGSKESVSKNEHEDETMKKHPPVISIKGRASKTTDESSSDYQRVRSSINLPVTSNPAEEAQDDCKVDLASAPNAAVGQTRSQKLTEVVKERLLREKVKASMINNHK